MSETALAKHYPTHRNDWRKRLKESLRWYPYIFVNLAVFLLFSLSAWVFIIYLSLHRWDLLGTRRFTGVANFAKMFSDRIFGIALKNTFQYLLLYVPSLSAFSLLIAILMNQAFRGAKVLKAAYFLPNVTSISVLAIIFWRMLSPRADSPINYIVGLVGIPPQDWLVSPVQALPSLAGVALWQEFGYFMVIWLAGLQGVPSELYDAAAVDGASGWRLHYHITLPMLRPTAAFILVITTMHALQVFGSIFVMTGGGPVYATTTLVYYIYSQTFNFGAMGYASAISIVLFLIIMAVTFVQSKYLHFDVGLY
jgi:ABC-type sugar transport system permease subunit